MNARTHRPRTPFLRQGAGALLALAFATSLGACLGRPARSPSEPGTAVGSPEGSSTAATLDPSASSSDAASDLLAGRSGAELVDQVAAAMRRPGFVYHQVLEREQDAEIYSNTGRFEHWLAADGRRAREHFRLQLNSQTEDQAILGRELVVDGERFVRDDDSGSFESTADPAPICARLSPAESLVFGCRAEQDVVWEAANGRYDGRPALVLTARFSQAGQPDAEIQAEAWYLDPETLLPFALRAEGLILFGSPTPYTARGRVTGEFLAEDALPAGLFDPLAPDPMP
ncbi:MAG: hypothetical protein H6648_09590 [Caldilineae bacterium]|nr:hypothetical protein [Chloroflexota bacterium]MCB9177400.1 hypothetical protein [Caldilineae bacterium]